MRRWSSCSGCRRARRRGPRGRLGFGGHGHHAAFGRVAQQGFAQRGGYELAGRYALLVAYEVHGLVLHVVAPVQGDHAVRRGLGTGGQRGQRHGRGGLLVVVAPRGVAGAAAHEAQEAVVGEVGRIAVEVLGPHRAHDELHDQAGRAGACDAARCEEEGEGAYDSDHGHAFFGSQIYAFYPIFRAKNARSFAKSISGRASISARRARQNAR